MTFSYLILYLIMLKNFWCNLYIFIWSESSFRRDKFGGENTLAYCINYTKTYSYQLLL